MQEALAKVEHEAKIYPWHDRIHAKSMVKILRKQKGKGLIAHYQDPFYFFAE